MRKYVKSGGRSLLLGPGSGERIEYFLRLCYTEKRKRGREEALSDAGRKGA